MKIKKHRKNVLLAMKSIADKELNVVNTLISLDTEGNLIIDGVNNSVDYTEEKISLNTSGKNVCIYGRKLQILSCSRKSIHISGTLEKIELYEVI